MKAEFLVCECGKLHGLFRYRFGCRDCPCGRRLLPVVENLRSVSEVAYDYEEGRRLVIEALLE